MPSRHNNLSPITSIPALDQCSFMCSSLGCAKPRCSYGFYIQHHEALLLGEPLVRQERNLAPARPGSRRNLQLQTPAAQHDDLDNMASAPALGGLHASVL